MKLAKSISVFISVSLMHENNNKIDVSVGLNIALKKEYFSYNHHNGITPWAEILISNIIYYEEKGFVFLKSAEKVIINIIVIMYIIVILYST